MRIEINGKNYFWFFFIMVILGFSFIYAYGGISPSIMGHTWKEIDFDDEFCRYVTGDDCAGGVSAEEPIVFILSGQSNMYGYNNVDDLSLGSQYLTIPSNVDFYDAGVADMGLSREVSFGGKGHIGPEVSLAKRLSDMYQDRKVVILKFAVSGTSIHQWNPDFIIPQYIYDNPDMVSQDSRLYEKMINYIDMLPYSSVEYGGFFWLQGESDVGYINDLDLDTDSRKDDYIDLTRKFFNRLRDDLGSSSMLIVMGMIHPGIGSCSWGDNYYGGGHIDEIEFIRSKQSQIAQEMSNVKVFDTYSLDCYDYDLIHFTPNSQIELGNMFADVY